VAAQTLAVVALVAIEQHQDFLFLQVLQLQLQLVLEVLAAMGQILRPAVKILYFQPLHPLVVVTAEPQTAALIGTAQVVALVAVAQEMALAQRGAQVTPHPLLHRKVALAATESKQALYILRVVVAALLLLVVMVNPTLVVMVVMELRLQLLEHL
jgi:hypothetical protein